MDIDNAQDITPEDSVAPVYLIPLTEEEIVQRQEEYEKFLKQEQAEKDQQVQKEQNLKAAIEKLSKLGLTEEEAKAIAGV
jgi:DNA-binding transcriptional regulator YhcF (GntR family)